MKSWPFLCWGWSARGHQFRGSASSLRSPSDREFSAQRCSVERVPVRLRSSKPFRRVSRQQLHWVHLGPKSAKPQVLGELWLLRLLYRPIRWLNPLASCTVASGTFHFKQVNILASENAWVPGRNVPPGSNIMRYVTTCWSREWSFPRQEPMLWPTEKESSEWLCFFIWKFFWDEGTIFWRRVTNLSRASLMTIFIRLGRKQQKASDEGAPSTCENPKTPRTSPVAKRKPEQNHMKNHIILGADAS